MKSRYTSSRWENIDIKEGGVEMADLIDLSWDRFSLETDFQDQISPNFKFYELIRSETADRRRINNTFEKVEELRSAVYLCRNVLQAVRNQFGRFSPNSVYRGQELERAIKKKRKDWISKSQHTRGQACDIEIPGLSTIDLATWVSENLEFDQVICECFNQANGPNSGWVHVSLVPPGMEDNRKKLLSYVMDPDKGKYVYVNGLSESVA
jgi:Peptidase M15